MGANDKTIIETVVIEIVAKAEQFMNSVEDSVENAKEKMAELGGVTTETAARIQENMGLVRDLATSLGSSFEESSRQLVNSGIISQEAADEAVVGLKKIEMQAGKTGKNMQKLVKGAKLLLKAFLGLSVLSVLKSLSTFVKESVEDFAKLQFETFRLNVALRASQRRVGEQIGVMEDWSATIERIRLQFGIFSRQDVTAATAKILLLTRELKFNKEQTEEVIQASIILAEVTGREVEDAARRLALFLDTGYSRGLAQLGIQLTTATVKESEYAHALGKTWDEMSKAERGTASLIEVMKQVSPLMDDAGRAAETFKGQLMGIDARLTDMKAEIGEQISPIVLAFAKVKFYFIETFIKPIFTATDALIKGLSIVLLMATKSATFMVTLYGRIVVEIRTLSFDIGQAFQDAADVSEESARIMADAIGGLFPKDFSDDALDSMGEFSDVLEDGEEAARDYDEAVSEALEEVADEAVKTGQRMSDAWKEYTRDLEDLTRDFQQGLADLQTDLQREMASIERTFSDAIASAQISLQRKMQDIAINTNQKMADAQRDYRRTELQAEEEFNLKMKRLNEDFAMNMQDAVRERDARKILDLMQGKSVDDNRAFEDFEIARQKRLDAYRQEIQDIKLQAARARQEAKLAFDRKIRDEERRRAISRREAQIAYAEDQEDLVLHNQRMREQAFLDYTRRMQDLYKYLQRRIELLAQALQQEFNLTAEALQYLLDMMATVIGENGIAVQMFGTALAGMNAQYATGLSGAAASGGTSTMMMAEGGVAVADKATNVTFGEAGKELAAFIPLNKLQSDSPLFSGGSKGQDKVQIGISLGEGLVAEIIDQSLGEVADIFVELNEE